MKEDLYDDLVQQEQKETNIGEILFKYAIHWKWFLLSVVLCLTGAWFYLRYATPQYEISATIMVKDDKKGGVTGEMMALQDFGLIGGGGNIDNEIEILKSRSLVKKTVLDLSLHTSYITKGTIGTKDLYAESPIDLIINDSILEKITNPILLTVTCKPNNSMLVVTTIDEQVIEKNITELPALVNTQQGEVTVSLRPNAKPIIDTEIFVTIASPIRVTKGYQDALSIEPTSKTTSIATLNHVNTNIKRGEDFLNRLIHVYNQDANEDKNQVALKTALFIDERLKIISGELGTTEEELENFKRNAGLTDLTTNAQLYLKESSEYEKMSVSTATQISLIEYLRSYVTDEQKRDEVIPANVGLEDVSLAALINKYNEQVLNRKRLLRTSSAGSPVIQNLNSLINDMRQSIISSVNSVYKGLLITQKEINRQTGKFTRRINEAPAQERAFTGISRQQEIKSGLYLMLLQKREENSIALATTSDNAKVVDCAIASEMPISPKHNIVWVVAFLLGLLIPILVIYTKELLRFHIDDRSDIENLTDIPLLGEVPLNKTKGEQSAIVVKEGKNDQFTESFRNLRTNLQFILDTPEKKVIIVTSSIPGEGKTFISSNLAISLALLGKKVIIVGLDIRKPQLQQRFKLNKDQKEGITHYLSGAESDLFALIHHSSASANLDVLPGGAIPPNPSELLSRQLMDDVILQLRSKYDYIILDTPPVGLVSDTLILAHSADATIYVCRSEYTRKADFVLVNQLLKEKRLPKLTIAINAVDIKKKRYGYYGHYGYGYGYENENES